MRKILLLPLAILWTCLWCSCADDDSFTLSPGALLTFSDDTVSLDTVFSRVPTPTKTFWVYNKSGDGIRCPSVYLSEGNQTGFRVNVDGEYLGQGVGYQVHDVELRSGDSARVFVELTSRDNGEDGPMLLEDDLVFSLESGVEQRVNLRAFSWDATIVRDLVVSGDTTIDSPSRPVLVYGGIKVDSAATLRIAPGTTIYFHNDAGIDVDGRLLSEGTAGANVTLRGDRLDNMFDYLPYDNVSGQWQGVRLGTSSYENVISYTDLHGAYDGIVCDSSDVSRLKLSLYESTVHNCQGYCLRSDNSVVDVRNCQLTNALEDCVAIFGGAAYLLHCTIAQFYPFDSNRGVALRYSNHRDGSTWPLYQMDCINSVVTGYGEDQIMGESVDSVTYYTYGFVNSLLRTPEVDDTINISGVIWESPEDSINGDMHFRLVDLDNQRYDFRLDSVSTAIGMADPGYAIPTDRLGFPRDDEPDMGCYEYEYPAGAAGDSRDDGDTDGDAQGQETAPDASP